MTIKKAGGQPGNFDDTGGAIVTPILPQEAAHFQPLLDQAARRMEQDPARLADHQAIWMSLFFAANGWPWHGRVRQ